MFAENFRAESETQEIHGYADGYQPFDHGDLQKTELVKQRLFFEDFQKQSRNVSFGVQKQLSAMKGSFPPESAPETTGRENRAERIETRSAVLRLDFFSLIVYNGRNRRKRNNYGCDD